ncbi:hypothetical protein [Halalkalicoccus ordinarius]|uniref:hypothetical protein n=1 Tax=Halalkalicoccus ordinarius TaxID=3116651 RepID=UPI00300F72C1
MDSVVLVGSLTGVELLSLASLALAVIALVGLVVGLERYVFVESDVDPVGLDDLERDEDVDGDAWR